MKHTLPPYYETGQGVCIDPAIKQIWQHKFKGYSSGCIKVNMLIIIQQR